MFIASFAVCMTLQTLPSHHEPSFRSPFLLIDLATYFFPVCFRLCNGIGECVDVLVLLVRCGTPLSWTWQQGSLSKSA